MKKNISFYLMIAALVCGILSIILYFSTGITVFTPKLSIPVIVFAIIGSIIGVISLFVEHKLISYATYISFLFSMLMYLVTEITYIANIFVAIDNTTFSLSFIFEILSMLGAIALSLISAIKQKEDDNEEVTA